MLFSNPGYLQSTHSTNRNLNTFLYVYSRNVKEERIRTTDLISRFQRTSLDSN